MTVETFLQDFEASDPGNHAHDLTWGYRTKAIQIIRRQQEALKGILQQIDKATLTDELGHNFKLNAAHLKAKETVDGKPTDAGPVCRCHTCTQETYGPMCESLIKIPFTFNQEGKSVI